MYNEEQKMQFISSHSGNNTTAANLSRLFKALEQQEVKFGKDFCEFSEDEIQEAFGHVMAPGSDGQARTVRHLRAYVEWCKSFREVSDSIFTMRFREIETIRKYYVSGPLHLQTCMNAFFRKEDENTIDNVYRTYLWLAFMGVREDDAIMVTSDCLDFSDQSLIFMDRRYTIYKESVECLKSAAFSSSFKVVHPGYTKDSFQDRADGSALLRGIKTSGGVGENRCKILMKRRDSKDPRSGLLTYRRLLKSGTFYRVFERERAGIPIGFLELSLAILSGRDGVKPKDSGDTVKQFKKYEKGLRDEYERWKLAYYT